MKILQAFPTTWKYSIPMKPFIKTKQQKTKKQLSLIYMEKFWAFPDLKSNLTNRTINT